MNNEIKIIHHQIGSINVYLLPLSTVSDWDEVERSMNATEAFGANAIQHQSKRREYLAVRIIKRKTFPDTQLCYTDIGAPYLINGSHISISHTEGLVGIASCKYFPIGFDLEGYKDKIKLIAPKFLSKNEINQIAPFETNNIIPYWCAKEVLYKVSGKIGWQFNKEFIIKQTDQNEFLGEIRPLDDSIKSTFTKIVYKDLGEYCMAVNINPLE